MPPSRSVIERGNPPPRKKSCGACIKAKRRCDLHRPTCLRCAQRGADCVYPKVPAHVIPDFQTEPQKEPQLVVAGPLTAPVPTAPEVGIPLLAGTDALVDQSLWSQQLLTTVAIDPSLSQLPLPSYEDVDAWTILLDNPSHESPSSNSSHSEPQNLDLIAKPSGMLNPPRIRGFGAIGADFTNRLQYAIDRVRDAPRMMVMENQTPWSHPSLYKGTMPRAMQDAYSSCALYISKNYINAPTIFRCIESRIDDLLATPQPTDPAEILARAQALLLYHIIRTLDGDIYARNAAEKTIPALEEAGVALLAIIEFNANPDVEPSPLPLYPLAQANDFWTHWVFQESARRTFLMTFLFLQVFQVLIGHEPTHCNETTYMCHYWTLSAYLWGASDAFDFAVAWGSRRHFIITSQNLMSVLNEAGAADLEIFGKILFTSMMGKEETKAWFATRGGSLE